MHLLIHFFVMDIVRNTGNRRNSHEGVNCLIESFLYCFKHNFMHTMATAHTIYVFPWFHCEYIAQEHSLESPNGSSEV